jgi:hypothetical protein
MLARYGIEPERLFGMTLRQLNALCEYESRAARARREYELSEEMSAK